jgi:iron(II)-dependent oxidoreductase
MSIATPPVGDSAESLLSGLREVRQRTLALVADLSDDQLLGPRLPIVNPLLWEIGHTAWFQEFWLLRHLRGLSPLVTYGDSLYDSARVAHDTRWDIPLLSRADALAYMQRVLERIHEEHHADRSAAARAASSGEELYFFRLALVHEAMHDEAFTYTRQTLGYPPPQFASPSFLQATTGAQAAAPGDGAIPGGAFSMGTAPGPVFVFDNEQWAHTLTLEPFRIARTAVSNAQFAAFADDGGYRREELWTREGWQWRTQVAAEHPVYWQRQSNGRWLRRHFDSWVPLEERDPVLHVNWFEAMAYCRWAGRRLPSEPEWEMAASLAPAAAGRGLTEEKRPYPWGDQPPSPERANLDWRAMSTLPVDDLPAGDSGFGIRQMIGNTWEWTADSFGPYPGFSPGPYKEYSQPWFGDHKVLRGGCWATRSFLIANTYRNFYKPDRRDVWAGFRTCAV